MAFWNYIGEFFLFRWLFGFHKCNETKNDLSTPITNSGNRDVDELDSHISFGRHYDNRYSRYDNLNYGYSQSYDDFHDDQDDYDMMDDDF